MSTNKVAILIPTYNREKFIIQCIENALSQTHQDLMVIVYDDGSNDSTSNLITNIKDQRLLHVRNVKNNGIVHARNELLSLAKSFKIEYACWQDSDDLSHPERVSLELEFIKQSNKPMVLAGWAVFKTLTSLQFGKVVPATNHEIIFASGLFEVGKVPLFREIRREPTPTTLGGEDVVWRNDLIARYGEPPELRQELYYVRRHNDRISVWRRNRALNPDWYKRMADRVK